MKPAPLPDNEADRLKALHSYKILDTLPEQAFDDLTALAAHICGTPIALISLTDAHRQWFKSTIGLAATEAPREIAFCAHAIMQPEQPLVVPDMLEDQRFATNPLVTSDPNIRFYAGAPLVTPQNYPLGTICVLDDTPRQLSDNQLEALQALSRQVVAQLELRQSLAKITRANQRLKQSEERFRSLVEGVKDYAIYRIDPHGQILSWNAGAQNIKGYQAAEILGQNFRCFYTAEDLEQGKPEKALKVAATTGRFEVESWRIRKNGKRFWANVVISPLYDQAGKIRGFVKVTRDLTERKKTEAALLRAAVTEATNQKLETEILQRKRAEKKLLYNAYHDALTGLPNRALFMKRLERSLRRTKQNNDYQFAVLFFDLDRFKAINDSFGHMVGDQLLQAITRRLKACLLKGETVARFGGDEFTILLEDIKNLDAAIQVAERIQRVLASPFVLNQQEVFTSVSIGIVLNSHSYIRPEEILRDADIAMYRAKNFGRARYTVFDTAMHSQAVKVLQIETDLRKAVERQDFHLYYQPIVSLSSSEILGFEALIRWQHSERGMISPVEFIPVAEETGLIVPIGMWVLGEACRQLRSWQREYPAMLESLTVSVNLSVKQFRQPNLVVQVAQILQETGLNPRSLKLEITESAIMEDTKSALATFLQLQALGVQLCMDDFGTGYSSLSYLHRFPFDILKIDRSFISELRANQQNLEIVRATVTLAHNMGMTVIAEGVETSEQRDFLKALDCKFAQGYFFSKPVDSLEAGRLIAGCGEPTRNLIASVGK